MTAPKRGFETEITTSSAEQYVAVQALGDQGQVLGQSAILDVGGGTSKLAGLLLAAGYSDVSRTSRVQRWRFPSRSLVPLPRQLTWVEADVRSHDFARLFDLWDDRTVFHFMVEDDDRAGYLRVLRRTLQPGGHLVLAAFGPEGPTQCSGLPVVRYGQTNSRTSRVEISS